MSRPSKASRKAAGKRTPRGRAPTLAEIPEVVDNARRLAEGRKLPTVTLDRIDAAEIRMRMLAATTMLFESTDGTLPREKRDSLLLGVLQCLHGTNQHISKALRASEVTK